MVALPFEVSGVVQRRAGGAYALGAAGELARVDGQGRLTGLFQTPLTSLVVTEDCVCGAEISGRVLCARDHHHDRTCSAAALAPLREVGAALSAGCDLRAELADGTLAIHARQLQGATLIVATPRGEVRVRGTVFQVSFAAAVGELRVGVEEGRVEVETRAGNTLELRQGQALRVAAERTQETFAPTAREQLRRTLGLSTPAHAAKPELGAPSDAPPAAALPLTDPVRAWHPGGVSAPEQSPELGSSVTEEGRPMSKPKVTPTNPTLQRKSVPPGETR